MQKAISGTCHNIGNFAAFGITWKNVARDFAHNYFHQRHPDRIHAADALAPRKDNLRPPARRRPRGSLRLGFRYAAASLRGAARVRLDLCVGRGGRMGALRSNKRICDAVLNITLKNFAARAIILLKHAGAWPRFSYHR